MVYTRRITQTCVCHLRCVSFPVRICRMPHQHCLLVVPRHQVSLGFSIFPTVETRPSCAANNVTCGYRRNDSSGGSRAGDLQENGRQRGCGAVPGERAALQGLLTRDSWDCGRERPLLGTSSGNRGGGFGFQLNLGSSEAGARGRKKGDPSLKASKIWAAGETRHSHC